MPDAGFLTNRELFSNHYLTQLLPETEAWETVEDEAVAEAFAERVFDRTVLDPAMGSGHFLTNAIDHLARAIVEAQEKQADLAGEETIDDSHDIHWARRQVAQQCIYGVDRRTGEAREKTKRAHPTRKKVRGNDSAKAF